MIVRTLLALVALQGALHTAFAASTGQVGATIPFLKAGAGASAPPAMAAPVRSQPVGVRPVDRIFPSPPAPGYPLGAAAGRGETSTRGALPKGPQIHPAVVRVVAPGTGTVSYGSGTLVDVNGDYGLVITNYHVIDEATGNISVIFPDGFYSLATVRKVDKDWDLAALVIKRPRTQPVSLSARAPQPGEPLTIAGYGSGNYRAVAGRCTQYVAPGNRMPFEMVELAASARQGDSGGPILNSRGELAGVLFGEGGGRTAGSYCGRVKWFLASLTDRPAVTPTAPAMPSFTIEPSTEKIATKESSMPPMVRLPQRALADEPASVVNRPAERFASHRVETLARENHSSGPEVSSLRTSLAPTAESIDLAGITGETLVDQAKTFLAILGCCTVLVFSLKALGGQSA